MATKTASKTSKRQAPPPKPIDTPEQPKPKKLPKSKQPKAPPQRVEPAQEDGRFTVPEAYQGRKAVELFLEGCEMFGLNPDPFAPTVEVMAWQHYPANMPGEDESIVLVTAGGRKLRVWRDSELEFDDETEHQLRDAFGAWGKDKDNNRIPLALPEDLTLPYTAATGHPANAEHAYPRGFLREGPKTGKAGTTKED